MSQRYPQFPTMDYEYVPQQQAMETACPQIGFQQIAQNGQYTQQPLLASSMLSTQQKQHQPVSTLYSAYPYIPQPPAAEQQQQRPFSVMNPSSNPSIISSRSAVANSAVSYQLQHRQPPQPQQVPFQQNSRVDTSGIMLSASALQQQYQQQAVYPLGYPPNGNIISNRSNSNSIGAANDAMRYQTQNQQENHQQLLGPAEDQQTQQKFQFMGNNIKRNTNDQPSCNQLQHPLMSCQQLRPNAPQMAADEALHVFEPVNNVMPQNANNVPLQNMQKPPTKRRCPSSERNVQNDEVCPMPVAVQERNLPAEWQPDFTCAHALVVQLTKNMCKKAENQCIRDVAEAIFGVVLPECWPQLQEMIVEANSGRVRAQPQQHTACIWMKAYVKPGLPVTENILLGKKNDVKRTNMSGRIHGLSLQNACLLFMIVRHEPCLGVRFGTDGEEGSLQKNEHCEAEHKQLINGHIVFCANPDHYETPATRRKKAQQERSSLPMATIVIPKWNRWQYASKETTISPDGLEIACTIGPTSNEGPLQYVYAVKGFSVSAEHARQKDNSVGTLIYYYEITQTAGRVGLISCGLQDGSTLNHNEYGSSVSANTSNTYCMTCSSEFCAFSGKGRQFEWPSGSIKPEWNGIGDVYGCGILLRPNNQLAIFFAGNGILMGKPIPIKPLAEQLLPIAVILGEASLKANFGENLAKPFKFDILKKWRELIVEEEILIELH